MCGVAGFIQSGLSYEEATAIAKRMTDRIAHRGPDGEGVWVEGPIALGHRRLAILDLSPTGAQPMASASGRFVIAFNGEIYNHVELRTALSAQGHRFRGTSDTEVLLTLVEAHGTARAIEMSVGMFAFALWDRAQRTLTLARDRMGEKPLYYGWQSDAFLFGSELKALRAHPAFTAGVDADAVAGLLKWGYVAAPRSIHSEIFKLRAGEMLQLSVGDGDGPLLSRCRQTLTRYWSIEERVAAGIERPLRGSLDEIANQLDERLSDSVRLQMHADVPVGAFLSGGIDSSLIVALMQRQSTQTVHTFSIGFDEAGFDESTEARRVAQHLGTRHTELRVSPAEARAVIPRLPEMFDEPFGDASQIPTYLVAALARREVTVSLSGDGGDELFGGYRKYAVGARLARVPARGAAGALLGSEPALALAQAVRRLNPRVDGRRLARLSSMLRADDTALAQMLSDNCPDIAAVVPDARIGAGSPVHSRESLPDAPYGVIASLQDLLAYLPDDVLTKVDRATMSVSLESRAPLLDHRVVEFACRLPWSIRGGDGNRKRVLRHLLYRLVPQRLVDRPKMGFSVPIAAWLRNELKPWAQALLADESAHRDGLLDRAALAARWTEHADGRADRSPLLWSALMFLAWRAKQP
jgi:asparagine synthase (glutamine-hydrolysing)